MILKGNCEKLLEPKKKRRIVELTTAPANDNLKKIKLNYDDYKDFTPQVSPGVETGYEMVDRDSDNNDDTTNDETNTASKSEQVISYQGHTVGDNMKCNNLCQRTSAEAAQNESSSERRSSRLKQRYEARKDTPLHETHEEMKRQSGNNQVKTIVEAASTKDPFRKPPLSQPDESFLQDGPCFLVAPSLSKCRECDWETNRQSKTTTDLFCRFYSFRQARDRVFFCFETV